MTPYVGGDGAFAEYLVVGSVTGSPDARRHGLRGRGGARPGLQRGLCSLDALALKAGQTLLVVGATGGVGRSPSSTRPVRGPGAGDGPAREEADFVTGLGADQAVDWSADLPTRYGPSPPTASTRCCTWPGSRVQAGLLAPGGCLASTLMFGPEQHPAAVSIIADPAQGTLDPLSSDVVAGRLRVPIRRSYPLEDAPQAASTTSRGGTLGKLAVAIR